MRIPRKYLILLTVFILALSLFNCIAYTIFFTGKLTYIASVSFQINGVPYLNITIPNQTWPQDQISTGIDLDDHFVDPDNDPLTYSYFGNQYVTVTIDEKSIVTFNPPSNWWGIDYVWFNATDPFGATGTSNRVMLNVTYTPPPQPPEEAGGGEGGAGRGADIECIEQWVCRDWTPCIDGVQTRTCRDLEHCGTNYSMPATWRTCHIPSCSDRIQNQNETGIDCGGPCPPCKTCFDGLQNCHAGECETGIDCGGPCLPCELKAIKEVEFLTTPWVSLSIILITIFSIEAYLYARKKKLREERLPFRPKKMKEAVKKLMRHSIDKEDKDK